MTGGIVIEVCIVALRDGKGNAVRLWCLDPNKPHDEMAVLTPIADELPKTGDQVWCKKNTIMWTARDLRFVDRKIEMVGKSFDPRFDDT